MTQQYDNTNKGTLFYNDRKEKDTHPDMTGSLNINGVDHWFSGWWKQSNGKDFISLSIGDPKKVQPGQSVARPAAPASRPGPRPSAPAPAPAVRAPGGFEDMDDSIPFFDPLKQRGVHLVF
jgi:hypothetical protein